VTAIAGTGTLLWSVALGEVVGQPSVRNGTVVAGTTSGTVAAIRDGTVAWRYQTDLPVAPTFVGDRVYATTGVGLIAIENGTEQWTRRVGGTMLVAPTVGEDVYIGTQINRTYAIGRDGSSAWLNQYSTTTADIPWADGDSAVTFWNPDDSVTRVVGPDGSVQESDTGESGGADVPLVAGLVVALSVLAVAYGYRRW
jgi:hypothetical protein